MKRGVSRPSPATAKKGTKQRDARVELLFCLINLSLVAVLVAVAVVVVVAKAA